MRAVEEGEVERAAQAFAWIVEPPIGCGGQVTHLHYSDDLGLAVSAANLVPVSQAHTA